MRGTDERAGSMFTRGLWLQLDERGGSQQAGPEARIDGLMSVLTYFRLSRNTAVTVFAQVEEAVSRLRDIGRGIGMTTRELDQFAEAFEHEERDEARKAIAVA